MYKFLNKIPLTSAEMCVDHKEMCNLEFRSERVIYKLKISMF